MNRSRWLRSRIFGGVVAILAAAVMVAPASHADSPAPDPAEETPRESIARVDLRASRVVGFAPMTLTVTGAARDGQGRAVTFGPDATASLSVASEALMMSTGEIKTSFVSSHTLESAENPHPGLHTNLVLDKPGRYTIRFVVTDGEQERLSNPVQIRVM